MAGSNAPDTPHTEPEDREPTLSRRTLLTGAAVVGVTAAAAAATVGPWLVKDTSSSGRLNLFTWPDYSHSEVIAAFERETGIKVHVTNYGNNAECMNKLRVAGAEGFDLAQPTLTELELHMQYELYQPLDESRLSNLSHIKKALYDRSDEIGAVKGGRRLALPYTWGTEAVAYRTDEVELTYGEASYGTLWEPRFAGRVTVRPHSAFLGAGLYLDRIGKVPSDRMLATYTSEGRMRQIYDQILAFLIEHKKSVRMFWNNAQDHQVAFLQNNCVIGQTWDGPVMKMKADNKPLGYLAPVEGAMTWVDTLCLVRGAENVEQAYAYIDWVYQARVGGLMSSKTGYNSVVEGAEAQASDSYRDNFAQAYPGEALDNLWWYVSEPPWFLPTRTEYRDRYQAA